MNHEEKAGGAAMFIFFNGLGHALIMPLPPPHSALVGGMNRA
jgi:hypothetical protein